MKVRFWGVRGSIACPGPQTAKFGGNTSCYEVEDSQGNIFVFDAGTGIRELGNSLVKRGAKTINLFISHTHWDHIQGFPFFIPSYIPGATINIYGPTHFEKSLRSIMDLQMDYAYFPVSRQQLNAQINFFDLKEEEITIGNTKISTKYSNHPVTALCYRLEENGKSFAYSGDFEPYYNVLDDSGAEAKEDDDDEDDFDFDDEDMDDIVEERNRAHEEFCSVDLLVHDAQYTKKEYPNFKGWGHSSMEYVLDMARTQKVKQLILTHHDPNRTDEELEKIEKTLKETYSDLDFSFSREGAEIEI
jgi:phosphoribosyl 1,2-cyclic phosphodiesterase